MAEPTTDESSSRWNPTKEQLGMLEGLYGQGMRTPSADQIQSIANRLQVYGQVEGTNVFYWFQNHKARLRQKQQKMDQMMSAANLDNKVVAKCVNSSGNANFNRFYHPYRPSSSPNFAFELGFNPHCPRTVLLPNPANIGLKKDVTSCPLFDLFGEGSRQEITTLDLFPEHPTGILQQRDHQSHSVASGHRRKSLEG